MELSRIEGRPSDLTFAEKIQIIDQCITPQELASQSMALLGNPLIIFDVNMHVIAITACDIQDPKYVHLYEHRYLSSDFIKEPGWQKLIRDMLRKDNLHIEKLDVNAHMRKIMRIGSTPVGHLEVVDYYRPFTEEDQLVLEVMSQFCASAVVKQKALQLPSGSQLDYMMEYLLDGNELSETEVLKQVNLCDWQPGRVLYLLCANAFLHGSDFFEFDNRVLAPADRAIRYKSNLLIILSKEKEMTRENVWALREHLEPLKMDFGLSRPFTQLSEIRWYFDQAQSALDIGNRVAHGCTLHPFDECLEYLPIMEAAKSIDVLTFVMPRLLELAEYDRNKKLCILYTLRDYVHNGRSVSTTASRLHLHRNTVSYRITKGLEFLGVSIDNSKAFTQLGESLRILEYVDQEYYFTH